MVRTEIGRSDGRKDEIFRGHRAAVEPAQECELTDVGHRIGEGSVKKLLVADPGCKRRIAEVIVERGESRGGWLKCERLRVTRAAGAPGYRTAA